MTHPLLSFCSVNSCQMWCLRAEMEIGYICVCIVFVIIMFFFSLPVFFHQIPFTLFRPHPSCPVLAYSVFTVLWLLPQYFWHSEFWDPPHAVFHCEVYFFLFKLIGVVLFLGRTKNSQRPSLTDGRRAVCPVNHQWPLSTLLQWLHSNNSLDLESFSQVRRERGAHVEKLN